MRYQVACRQGHLPTTCGAQVACEPVNVDAQLGRLERLEALANQGRDHTRQHVSRSTGRHARITRRVARDAPAVRNQSPVALEDQHNTPVASQLYGSFAQIFLRQLRMVIPDQAAELAGVWSEDSRSRRDRR